ncbi:hypothetical protein ACH4FV_37020 [Streptomyces anulatus]
MSEQPTTQPARQETAPTAQFTAPCGPVADALAITELGVQAGTGSSPAQCGVLLTTARRILTLTTHDTETAVTVTLPVDTTATGTSLLHHSQVKKALAAMVAGETKTAAARTAVSLIGDLLTTPHLSLPVPALDRAEFIDPPQPAPTVATVDVRQFLAQALRVLPAAGTDETLPALTGVRIAVDCQSVTLSATDRYRFAVADVPAAVDTTPPQEANSALVPAPVLARLAKRLKDHQGRARIGISTHGTPRLTLTTGATTITIRQLEGAQIRHSALFPKTTDCSLTLPRTTAQRALKKCHALIKAMGQTHAPVSLKWAEDGSLTLAPVLGTTEDRARTKGMALASTTTAGTVPRNRSVSLNPKFLADALTAFDGDTVTLHLRDEEPGKPLKPVLLTAGPDITEEDYRHLLMPVRLQDA